MSTDESKEKLEEEHAKQLEKAKVVCEIIRNISPQDIRDIEMEDFSDHSLVVLRLNHNRQEIKDLCPNVTMNAAKMESLFKGIGPNRKNTKIRMLKNLVKSQTEDMKSLAVKSGRLVEDAEREVRLASYNLPPDETESSALVKELRDLVSHLNDRVISVNDQLEVLNSGKSDVTQEIFARPPLKINCTIIPQRSDVPIGQSESGVYNMNV